MSKFLFDWYLISTGVWIGLMLFGTSEIKKLHKRSTLSILLFFVATFPTAVLIVPVTLTLYFINTLWRERKRA